MRQADLEKLPYVLGDINIMLEDFIKNMINRLHEAGIEDPTHQDVTCKFQNKIIKFRLHSQQQWDKMQHGKNIANRLYAKWGIGDKPDYTISTKNKVYLVKIL